MIKKNTAFSLLELSVVILIIGIAVTAVALSSRMMKESNLGLARSFTKSSDAAAVSGMVLWLDATAEKSMTNTSNSNAISNNENVKTWIDQNPQANEKFVFTEKASGQGPIYLENGINNLPSLYFNYASSAGDGLISPHSITLNPDQFTIFIVAKPIENTSTWQSLIVSRDYAIPTGFNLYINDSVASFHFWCGTGTTWEQTLESSTFSFNKPYVLSIIRTGIELTDNNIIYRNGVRTGISYSNAKFSPNKGTASGTRFFIGVAAESDAYFFDGYISEIIMYNRYLKSEERGLVETYLSKKYNIKF